MLSRLRFEPHVTETSPGSSFSWTCCRFASLHLIPRAGFCSEMSQNPTDSQALLQSMLQRLRLQPGRERPLAWGPDGARAAPGSGPTNGFDFAVPAKSFGLSSEDGSVGIRGEEGVQSGLGCGADSGRVSFPSLDSQGGESADVTSFDRTDGDMGGQEGQQEQGFTPRVYTWAMKPSDLDSAQNKAPHVGNGEFAAVTQNNHSASRRNPRPSDSKTRRWTQRIKEKWRERPGSKKGKEEAGRRPEQGVNMSPQSLQLTLEHGDEERTLPSSNSRDPTQTLSQDAAADALVRSSSDFEFGLGSFSLLDEIVTGQEWAKFLNPALSAPSAPSANQRPTEEPLSPLTPTVSPYDSARSPVSDRGGFTGCQSQSVSMGKPAGDQSEPMEDVNNQSHMQLEESGAQHHRALERADILDSSAPKIRISLNRKRQHQSRDGAGERGRFLSPPSSNAMEQTGDDLVPLFPLNSPPPPSFPTPHAPAPRGVLKHSISQDSQLSVETVTKRRRVEENRRVRFSEEILAIDPVEMDPDAAAQSEEEEEEEEEEYSWAEEDSVSEPAAMEEAAPARRPALPAWILALKRRNAGRKHR